jgi:hypothetical protein
MSASSRTTTSPAAGTWLITCSSSSSSTATATQQHTNTGLGFPRTHGTGAMSQVSVLAVLAVATLSRSSIACFTPSHKGSAQTKRCIAIITGCVCVCVCVPNSSNLPHKQAACLPPCLSHDIFLSRFILTPPSPQPLHHQTHTNWPRPEIAVSNDTSHALPCVNA